MPEPAEGRGLAPCDPRDERFCSCGAERGHYGWWWSCEERVAVLDAFRDVSAPARNDEVKP